MSQLVLATRNAGKLNELRRILAPLVPDLEVLGLDDVPAYEEVPETGATFADNALLKVRAAVAHTGLPAIADDSGLAVSALNGMPGIFSARWSGRHGDDTANLELLLAQLADVPDDRLTASFLCAAAFMLPSGEKQVIRAEMVGRLIRAPRGAGGFGYDPIFIPHGETLTSAELPAGRKDEISHRGKALRALAPLVAHAL